MQHLYQSQSKVLHTTCPTTTTQPAMNIKKEQRKSDTITVQYTKTNIQLRTRAMPCQPKEGRLHTAGGSEAESRYHEHLRRVRSYQVDCLWSCIDFFQLFIRWPSFVNAFIKNTVQENGTAGERRPIVAAKATATAAKNRKEGRTRETFM